MKLTEVMGAMQPWRGNMKLALLAPPPHGPRRVFPRSARGSLALERAPPFDDALKHRRECRGRAASLAMARRSSGVRA